MGGGGAEGVLRSLSLLVLALIFLDIFKLSLSVVTDLYQMSLSLIFFRDLFMGNQPPVKGNAEYVPIATTTTRN